MTDQLITSIQSPLLFGFTSASSPRLYLSQFVSSPRPFCRMHDSLMRNLIRNLFQMSYLRWVKESGKNTLALPCTEIWSHETFSITLRQIEFYHECGLFASAKQAQGVCDSYLDMIRKIQDFAVRGTKDGLKGTFSLYKNELIVADTTVLFRMGGKRVAFITHNTMNLLTTTQESFCQHTERYMSNLQQRSIMLSPTGEKERIKYFNSIEANTQRLKETMA